MREAPGASFSRSLWKKGLGYKGRQAPLKILREVYFVEFNNPVFFLFSFLFLSLEEMNRVTKENHGGGKISVLLIDVN